MRVGRRILALAVLGALLAPAGADAAPPQSTCFWEGPISTNVKSSRGFDGRDFNFPEESATYWLARFHMPAGGKVVLRGSFAHARYESLNAYDDGAPTDSLPDVATAPDAGSVNPFLAGARRDGSKRSYTVTVVDEAAPAPGAARAPNTLYAKAGAGKPIELLYRTYEPDRGLDLTGGAGLPAASVAAADGAAMEGDAACKQVNDPDRSIPVQTTPAAVWQGAVSAPGCDPATNPAYDPARWERFFNLNYASLAVISDCTSAGRSARLAQGAESQGGFYSNRDNAYVYAHLSRRFGPLFVVRGRMPSVPRTFDGEPVMGSGQLRFWSVCQNESRVTTRTVDCVADRQVPLSAPGRDYTIVMSRAGDRPPNASLRCGVAWLDWGERGDAAGRPDYGLLVMRNMLPATGFAQAIQNVKKPGDEASVMGPYFPRGEYTSRATFESRGCDPSRLTIGAGALRAGSSGRTAVTVGCAPARDECTGRLRLTSGGRWVGGARFVVPGGTTKSVPVRLRAFARRALAGGATLQARITARARSPFVLLTANRTARLSRG